MQRIETGRKTSRIYINLTLFNCLHFDLRLKFVSRLIVVDCGSRSTARAYETCQRKYKSDRSTNRSTKRFGSSSEVRKSWTIGSWIAVGFY